jgi:TfoX/Sxy family transcriptional regulator of competence genes
MASHEKFVTFICDQMAGAGPILARRIFGKFAIYCGEKAVALACDNQLFVKPTEEGKALLGDPSLAATTAELPVPNAKGAKRTGIKRKRRPGKFDTTQR